MKRAINHAPRSPESINTQPILKRDRHCSQPLERWTLETYGWLWEGMPFPSFARLERLNPVCRQCHDDLSNTFIKRRNEVQLLAALQSLGIRSERSLRHLSSLLEKSTNRRRGEVREKFSR